MIFLLIVQMTFVSRVQYVSWKCLAADQERKGTVPHKNWKGSESLAKVTKAWFTILTLPQRKTASKAPPYAGADAGIEISSIPASASSVNIVNQA